MDLLDFFVGAVEVLIGNGMQAELGGVEVQLSNEKKPGSLGSLMSTMWRCQGTSLLYTSKEHVSNEKKNWLFRVYRGLLLPRYLGLDDSSDLEKITLGGGFKYLFLLIFTPSYVGIMINHCKDHY